MQKLLQKFIDWLAECCSFSCCSPFSWLLRSPHSVSDKIAALLHLAKCPIKMIISPLALLLYSIQTKPTTNIRLYVTEPKLFSILRHSLSFSSLRNNYYQKDTLIDPFFIDFMHHLNWSHRNKKNWFSYPNELVIKFFAECVCKCKNICP